MKLPVRAKGDQFTVEDLGNAGQSRIPSRRGVPTSVDVAND